MSPVLAFSSSGFREFRGEGAGEALGEDAVEDEVAVFASSDSSSSSIIIGALILTDHLEY